MDHQHIAFGTTVKLQRILLFLLIDLFKKGDSEQTLLTYFVLILIQ